MAKAKDTINSVSAKPIIFSAEMVRALLDGRKTQTRRVIKADIPDAPGNATWAPDNGFKKIRRAGQIWSLHSPYLEGSRLLYGVAQCPYEPGDLLWVRETWRGVVPINAPWEAYRDGVARYTPDRDNCAGIEFRASHVDNNEPWRPSTQMPRWASRLTLRITNVRAERLQDISEVDAMAEGVTKVKDACFVIRGFDYDTVGLCHSSPVTPFEKYWDHLYGHDDVKGWHRNPWVWVYEFEVIQKNVDEVA